MRDRITTKNVLLLESLLCCVGRVFWVIVMLEYPSMTHFQCPGPTVHDPVHRPFDAVQLSCPLIRKTPPKHNVSTSMFDCVLGVIGSILPPPNTASWVDAKELDFGFIWPQLFQFSSESLANFRRDCACAFLRRGTLRALQDSSPSRRSVLPIVFLVTMIPAALRSLTSSSCVILGWFLTVLMINAMRWYLACSPRPREIDSYSAFH